jgi:hypothetical protein
LQEREGQLQEREELDDITLRCELEVLSTCETILDQRDADLEREQKDLEDARAQILTCELHTNSRETGLRDQEARLAAWERQLAERQMQELAIAQKGLEDLQASRSEEAQCIWSFLG